MRYICIFQDAGGNEVSILSADVDSEKDAILEVADRLKEISPDRAWSPLNCEARP